MKTPIFTGAATAIVTPFRGYSIDYDKMAELIEMQVNGGISCIVVCGTTGEAAAMESMVSLIESGFGEEE